MNHKFDVQNKNNLFSNLRKKILPAKRILKKIGLKEGMIFADIGCGNGYFTLPAYEIVGETGKIFAIDISEEMLSDLKKRIENYNNIKINNIKNINIIKNSENFIPLENNVIDLAFSSNVLHEVKEPDLFIKDIKRILKFNGIISIIDWEKTNNDNLNSNFNYGPDMSHRISKEEVQKILMQNNFKEIKYFTIKNLFYCVIAIRE